MSRDIRIVTDLVRIGSDEGGSFAMDDAHLPHHWTRCVESQHRVMSEEEVVGAVRVSGAVPQ